MLRLGDACRCVVVWMLIVERMWRRLNTHWNIYETGRITGLMVILIGENRNNLK